MSKDYLPVKESLGYKNIKKALQNVFKVDLDTIPIQEGKYEDFSFLFVYKNYKMDMIISSTGGHCQFELGEGGIFNILLPDPNYPEHSIFEQIFFSNLILDKQVSQSVHRISGKNEKDIEYAMQVLKDYLDSDIAKVLLKDE